jgi:hypothetical protein
MRTRWFQFGLWAFAGVVLLVSYCLSVMLCDSHWLNRGGALIAAGAALAGYLQIRFDIAAEKLRQRAEQQAGADEEAIGTPPIEALERRIREAARLAFTSTQEAERLGIGATVVGVAAMGEVLHGFGDLLLTTLKIGSACH